MSYVMAVTGKGGVGKSSVSALLVRLLLEHGGAPVLAVDADPNSTLAPMLGLAVEATISDIREEILKEKSNITGIPKERVLEMKLEECILESNGFDLLTMGHPEGPTCYCYVNNLLRGALTSLRANYRATVIDNEAGMEHLSRMNTDAVDCMLFVSEPTVSSALAVARIAGLSEGLPVEVRRKVLLWNKVKPRGIPEPALELLDGTRFDQTVHLPVDDEVELLSATGQSVFALEIPEHFINLLDACGARFRDTDLAKAKG